MTPLNTLVGIALVFGVLLVYGFFKRPPNPVAALQAEYLVLMRLGPVKGRAHLAERMEALSQRFPGRSDGWYLQWLIDDLRKAKR